MRTCAALGASATSGAAATSGADTALGAAAGPGDRCCKRLQGELGRVAACVQQRFAVHMRAAVHIHVSHRRMHGGRHTLRKAPVATSEVAACPAGSGQPEDKRSRAQRTSCRDGQVAARPLQTSSCADSHADEQPLQAHAHVAGGQARRPCAQGARCRPRCQVPSNVPGEAPPGVNRPTFRNTWCLARMRLCRACVGRTLGLECHTRVETSHSRWDVTLGLGCHT
eukprot:351515-Chlamydomonas_euryale.AAC.2